MGRFINADAYSSTGQGFLGNNMFTYCLNNPANYYDINGEDAIWIHEDDSANKFGHSGLLVQDEEDQWWYFYWGPEDPNANILLMCVNTPEICVFKNVDTDGFDMRETSDVKKALAQYPNDTRVGEQADDITSTTYYEGNYTRTYKFLSILHEVSGKTNLLNYSLLMNNCSQVSAMAMSMSNASFMNVFSLIPDFMNWQQEKKIFFHY